MKKDIQQKGRGRERVNMAMEKEIANLQTLV